MKQVITEWLDETEKELIETYADAHSMAGDEVRKKFGPSTNWIPIILGLKEWSIDAHFALCIGTMRSIRRRAELDPEKALKHALSLGPRVGIAMLAMSNKENPSQLRWQTTPSAMAALVASMGRHKESREDKEFARNYWLENIDPALSASKARCFSR